MKNGTEVSRLISRDSTMSFLTDSLVGVLKNDTGTDEKALNAVVAIIRKKGSKWADFDTKTAKTRS